MAKEYKLSIEELTNLRRGLEKAFKDLEMNSDLFNDFNETPFIFLERYNIVILSYVNSVRSIKNRFEVAVREIIQSFGRYVNPCLVCKLAVLLIISAILGKAGVAWAGVLEFSDKILESLKEYFEGTQSQLERIIVNLDERIDRMRPSLLALKICEGLGYCPIRR